MTSKTLHGPIYIHTYNVLHTLLKIHTKLSYILIFTLIFPATWSIMCFADQYGSGMAWALNLLAHSDIRLVGCCCCWVALSVKHECNSLLLTRIIFQSQAGLRQEEQAEEECMVSRIKGGSWRPTISPLKSWVKKLILAICHCQVTRTWLQLVSEWPQQPQTGRRF